MMIYEKKARAYLKGWQGTGFHGYPLMFHNHAELIYIVRGSLHVTVGEESFVLRERQLFVLFSSLPHSYQDAPDTQFILMLFDPSVTAFTKTLLHEKPICPVIDGSPFAPMLERALTLLRQNKTKTATAYLNVVLGEFLERVDLDPMPTDRKNMTAKILEYCTEHFAEGISLKQVADALLISQSSVSKLFSERLHYSFRDYINDLRIEQAKTLLQDTDQPIIEVMFSCGFTNQSSFNRVFRSACGCTPREYRQRANTTDKQSGERE